MQAKAISSRLNIRKAAKSLERKMADFKKDVLVNTAEVIAQTSPVDTGTYVQNHQVRLRSGSFVPSVPIPEGAKSIKNTSSEGKARQDGLSQMKSDIESIDLTKDTIVFRNATTHARAVENYDEVYAKARIEMANIVNASVQRARAKK